MVGRMVLHALARKYGTDKGDMHQYTKVYEKLLQKKRRKVRKVLEIGIKEGASLRMWRDYFPKAVVYGIDCLEEYLVTEDRIVSFLADQGKREEMEGLPLGKDFDLIVDDGSHLLSDQIVSFQVLFPLLKKGGLYVVEDVGSEDFQQWLTVPWRRVFCKQGDLIVIDNCYD